MIVVDASVAAKWLFLEPGTTDALALLSRFRGEMHAPDLILVEVAGAVVRRINAREIDEAVASAELAAWREVAAPKTLTLHPASMALIERSAHIAIGLGHPIEDCVYLALANELGCGLVTADAKFRDRAAERFPAVKLLGELA